MMEIRATPNMEPVTMATIRISLLLSLRLLSRSRWSSKNRWAVGSSSQRHCCRCMLGPLQAVGIPVHFRFLVCTLLGSWQFSCEQPTHWLHRAQFGVAEAATALVPLRQPGMALQAVVSSAEPRHLLVTEHWRRRIRDPSPQLMSHFVHCDQALQSTPHGCLLHCWVCLVTPRQVSGWLGVLHQRWRLIRPGPQEVEHGDHTPQIDHPGLPARWQGRWLQGIWWCCTPLIHSTATAVGGQERCRRRNPPPHLTGHPLHCDHSVPGAEQGGALHGITWKLLPGQSTSEVLGTVGGGTHWRSLYWSLLPQVCGQGLHCPQLPHVPFTASCSMYWEVDSFPGTKRVARSSLGPVAPAVLSLCIAAALHCDHFLGVPTATADIIQPLSRSLQSQVSSLFSSWPTPSMWASSWLISAAVASSDCR